MKILLIEACNFEDFPTGGHLAFARNMLKAYPERDLVLVGITTDPSFPVGKWTKRIINNKEYDYFAILRRSKDPRRPIIPSRLSAALTLWKYRHRILKHSYDRIFFQTFETLLALPVSCLSRACIRIPGVENPLHFSRYLWARRLSWIYDLWYYKKLKHVKVVLATASTEAIQEFYRIGEKHISLESIHQFPTRFDRDIYHVMDRKECRKQINIPADVPVFVTVGRLAEFKGWRLLIDSFHLFHNSNPHALFYFIGDGEDEAKISSYIQECGLSDSCFLVGRKSPHEISSYLNAASVFAMGSFLEGWSTTLVEACACGIPCVVTDFSSAKDMIVNGKNGYVVEERDPHLFADCLSKAIRMDRDAVIAFDSKYDSLAVQVLPTALSPFFQ